MISVDGYAAPDRRPADLPLGLLDAVRVLARRAGCDVGAPACAGGVLGEREHVGVEPAERARASSAVPPLSQSRLPWNTRHRHAPGPAAAVRRGTQQRPAERDTARRRARQLQRRGSSLPATNATTSDGSESANRYGVTPGAQRRCGCRCHPTTWLATSTAIAPTTVHPPMISTRARPMRAGTTVPSVTHPQVAAVPVSSASTERSVSDAQRFAGRSRLDAARIVSTVAGVAQLAEAQVFRYRQCGFESHRRHASRSTASGHRDPRRAASSVTLTSVRSRLTGMVVIAAAAVAHFASMPVSSAASSASRATPARSMRPTLPWASSTRSRRSSGSPGRRPGRSRPAALAARPEQPAEHVAGRPHPVPALALLAPAPHHRGTVGGGFLLVCNLAPAWPRTSAASSALAASIGRPGAALAQRVWKSSADSSGLRVQLELLVDVQVDRSDAHQVVDEVPLDLLPRPRFADRRAASSRYATPDGAAREREVVDGDADDASWRRSGRPAGTGPAIRPRRGRGRPLPRRSGVAPWRRWPARTRVPDGVTADIGEPRRAGVDPAHARSLRQRLASPAWRRLAGGSAGPGGAAAPRRAVARRGAASPARRRAASAVAREPA